MIKASGGIDVSLWVIISAIFTLIMLFIAYIWLPKRMNAAYRQSLLTLSRIVEAKDSWLEGRGERIVSCVLLVLQKLNLSKKQKQIIEYAAYLGDIGYVSVPYRILTKTEELSESEVERFQQHPIVGEEIISQVTFLKDIAPIIRHHHEAWDGSGYPDGLIGESIPLGSRILAICDTFDTMLYPGNKDSELTKQDVLEYIQSKSGILYDPKIVKIFVEVMKDSIADRK